MDVNTQYLWVPAPEARISAGHRGRGQEPEQEPERASRERVHGAPPPANATAPSSRGHAQQANPGEWSGPGPPPGATAGGV